MLDLNDMFDNGFVTRPATFESAEHETIFDHLINLLVASPNRTLDADVFLGELTAVLGKDDNNTCRLHLNNDFLTKYPEFYAFIKNMNTSAAVEVKCCEKIWAISNPNPTQYNFMEIKAISNAMHQDRWTRNTTLKDRQGGVSVLGGISELLLNKALDTLVSDDNFFYKSSHMQPQIRSYGDFVLMCQPNNLWMSVKSGFSRERLLASGYTNDVIGIGFFQDAGEFTNIKRLKNFKKAGFLAIYLPDEPVTQDQLETRTNTHQSVEEAYNDGASMPKNINETPLLRKLSNLHSDLKDIVDIDLKLRNLSDF